MTPVASPIRALVRAESRRQAGRLALAALSAAGASAAAVLLLGLSGWFLTAAAAAGAAGAAASMAFNYLLPSAAIRFLAIARTGLRYGERLAGHAAALKALAEIRPALFAGLAAAPAEQALGFSSGEATARLVQDVGALESMFVRLSTPWAALAATLAAVVLTTIANPWAPLVFLSALAAQIAIGAWVGRERSRVPAGEVLRATGLIRGQLQAYVAASAELRCYGATGAAIDALMRIDERLGAARRRGWNALAEMGVVQPILTGAATAGVLAVCGHASPPLTALAALSVVVALEGAGGLLQAFDRTGAVEAAAERLDEVLAAPPTTPSAAGLDLVPSIGLRLVDQTRRLRPGQRWALTGPAGVGKTRLLETMLGLRTPTAGEVTLGGQALENLNPQDCRTLFAYAPQDAPMLSGTVRENLALGDPTASDAALWEALGAAQLAEKVRRMPGGLDAWIGEAGASLSGGERRRLSLARAFLRSAPWLLLDEPTEGLDAITEAGVIEAIASHLDRTRQGLILISHRPAPLTLCDHGICLSAKGARRVSRSNRPRRRSVMTRPPLIKPIMAAN